MTVKGYLVLLVFVYCYTSITIEGKKSVDKKRQSLTNVYVFEDAKKLPPKKTTYDQKPGKKIVNPVVKIIPKVKKPVIEKPAEKKLTTKQKVLEKLRHVKSTEDFLKHFQVDKSIKLKKVKTTQLEAKKHLTRDVYQINSVSRDATSSSSFFQEFDCKPRPTVVQIPSMDDEAANWPSCGELHQCSGCCVGGSHFYECAPIKLENRSTPVFRIPYDGSASTLQNVYMLHHAACGCKCRVQPSDCNPGQTYDRANCACVCNKKAQHCPIGKQWSDTACDCVCSQQNPSCPKRRYWNEKRCSCDCNTDPCPVNHLKDPSTCLCIQISMYPNKFLNNKEWKKTTF